MVQFFHKYNKNITIIITSIFFYRLTGPQVACANLGGSVYSVNVLFFFIYTCMYVCIYIYI